MKNWEFPGSPVVRTLCSHCWGTKIPQAVWCGKNRTNKNKNKKHEEENQGTSLAAQWLRIHLPMQGTQVRALVREDPTCCGATKPVCQNY